MSEPDVAAKLAHRGRGLLKLERHVGPVCGEVEKRLSDAGKRVQLLEIGCGFGVALMELRRRFSDRIELTGTNKEKHHGDAEAMLMAASLCNANDVSEAQTTALPTIICCDMASGLPFGDAVAEIVLFRITT